MHPCYLTTYTERMAVGMQDELERRCRRLTEQLRGPDGQVHVRGYRRVLRGADPFVNAPITDALAIPDRRRKAKRRTRDAEEEPETGVRVTQVQAFGRGWALGHFVDGPRASGWDWRRGVAAHLEFLCTHRNVALSEAEKQLLVDRSLWQA